MQKWLNSHELAESLGITWSQGKRILAAKSYKKTNLKIRKVKSQKGKPKTLVLWDTTTNQPVSGDVDDEKNLYPDQNPVSAPDACAVPVAQSDTIAVQLPTEEDDIKPCVDADIESSVLLAKTQAGALLPGQAMDIVTAQPIPGPVVLVTEEEPLSDDTTAEVPLDFEVLLHRKLLDKPANNRRALAAYYRKQYQKTGIIPISLSVSEGRRFSGKKNSLDKDIQARFVEMVVKSTDENDIFNYYTKEHRKVTIFHAELEKEFGRKIAISQLYNLVRSGNLSHYLNKTDDETDSDKLPSYFKAEPVGSLVQMDGVEADFLEILIDGKWKKPLWIELFDLGSRKILAMHGYLCESNETSVDIFTRFLADNPFAHQPMKIRPDNAKGFLNLKRPIKELNNRYALPDGFAFIDDFARASKPKDKAHLESSHRVVHSFERIIISHFKDKIAGQYKKNKKVGNQMRTVTVTQLAISLDELNDSTLIADYMHKHNSKNHRFQEDGVSRSWIPNERWDEYLQANKTFSFIEKDIELVKRYGYTKASATISKEGIITYKNKRYYVAKRELWSRNSGTKVKVSLIGDKLAIFKDSDDGVWKGDAELMAAPVKSEKAIAREKAKVVAIHSDNERGSVVKALQDFNMMIVSEVRLNQFISEGLTLEMTERLLANNYQRYKQKEGSIIPFNFFLSDVKKKLAEVYPQKLKPYAGVSS